MRFAGSTVPAGVERFAPTAQARPNLRLANSARLEGGWGGRDYFWSVRGKALRREGMPGIRRRFGFRAQTEPPLLGSSSRPLDYRGREKKRPPRRRLCGRTQPGTLRKPHLPRKTDPWDVQVPGFRESDRVWPSDYSAAGDFCSSLNRTDLHRGWAETRSVLGKSPEAVSSDWETIRQAFPFRWRGIDSAKGSEFSQDPRRRYGPAREVQFRRGRPYR